MKTLINIRTDPEVKRRAQKAAKALGMPLSTIVNAYLTQFGREQEIHFSVPLRPNKKTAKLLDQAREDYVHGRNISPAFDNADDAIAWLKKK